MPSSANDIYWIILLVKAVAVICVDVDALVRSFFVVRRQSNRRDLSRRQALGKNVISAGEDLKRLVGMGPLFGEVPPSDK